MDLQRDCTPKSKEMEYRPYSERLKEFATELSFEAEKLDTEGATCQKWYREFVQRELHLGGSELLPFQTGEFCESLSVLSEASGAFGFLALQQFVSNGRLGASIQQFDQVPAIGVAYGHLRNPVATCPRLREGSISGRIPWFTGSEMFEYVIFGFLDEQNREILTLIEANNRPQFYYEPEMKLTACSGTKTVQVTVDQLKVREEHYLSVNDPGSMSRGDAGGVHYHTPLMVGNIRASQKEIMRCERIPTELRVRSQDRTENLLSQIRNAFANGISASESAKLRAETGDYSIRLARLCAMAVGGASLSAFHPAQRRYREALVFNLMAQTDEVLADAFHSVFEP